MSGAAHPSWWKTYWQWVAIPILGIATFAMGLIGFDRYFQSHGQSEPFSNTLYRTIQLYLAFGGSVQGPVPMELNIARFLAPIIPAWAIFKTVTILLAETFQRMRLRRISNHAVISGYGRKGKQLADDLLQRGERVVIIDSNFSENRIRLLRERGVIGLKGDASDPSVLSRARLHRAHYLFSTTGTDETNLEVMMAVRGIIAKQGSSVSGGLRCFIHLVDLGLYELLRARFPVGEEGGQLTVRVFNSYMNCARFLLSSHPLDYRPIAADSAVSSHLIVIGFGQMGQCVALQAARIGHFANGHKLRVMVIDREMDARRATFLHQYPAFPEICDVKYVNGDVVDPEIVSTIQEEAKDTESLATIAICFDQNVPSLSVALSLLDALKENRPPLLVRMGSDSELVSVLDGKSDPMEDAPGVHVFGLTRSGCTFEMVVQETLDVLARAVHKKYLESVSADQQGEDSGQPWEKLAETYRDASRQNADHIEVKLRAIEAYSAPSGSEGESISEFPAEEIETLAQMEHQRWVAERRLSGWTAGPKDVSNRMNPHLGSWEQLDESVRVIDRDTVREIPKILGEAGRGVYRK